MRRWLLLATALVLAGVLVLAAVFVRRSVIAGIVRSAAEARLSAAIGQRVSIGDVGFSLVPRPVFAGTDVRVGDADQSAPAVRLDRVDVFPRLRSFFSSTVRIDEIRLDGFEVAVLRDPDGRWHVPPAFPSPSPSGAAGVAIDRVRIAGGRLRVFDGSAGRARETSRVDAIHAEMLIEQRGLRLAPLGGRVGSAAIEGDARVEPGSVRLSFRAEAIADADLPALLGLLGSSRPAALRLNEPATASVAVAIDRATSRLSGTGTLRVPELTVDPLPLQRVEALFTIDGSRLTFTPTTFSVSGGTHRGRVVLALEADPPHWSAESRLERLDVGAFLDALAARDARIDGTGTIDANLRGRVVENFVSGMNGRARLEVSQGVLHDFPLVATIDRALQLTESSGPDTRFERLTAALALAGAGAATDDLVMEAGHLRVELAGRIGFDRSLNLRGRAVVSKERTAEAVRRVRELARVRNSEGVIELPLTIGGRFDAPQFGIDMETAIIQGARDELMRRLRRLLRRAP